MIIQLEIKGRGKIKLRKGWRLRRKNIIIEVKMKIIPDKRKKLKLSNTVMVKKFIKIIRVSMNNRMIVIKIIYNLNQNKEKTMKMTKFYH